MKKFFKILGIIIAIIIAVLILAIMIFRKPIGVFLDDLLSTVDKPIIYLYPEETTEVEVKLDYDGEFTVTYPKYNDGWQVTAHPDGTLVDKNGREYYSLFWEGICNTTYDCTKGFVIPGNETEKFLEEALGTLGLTDKEADEFIIYWLPQMQDNKYNFISFQTDCYTDSAKLEVAPEPDSVIRVFMAWKPLEKFEKIPPQTLVTPERTGFTVVEWGGTVLN